MIYFLILILSLLFTPSVYAQTYTITCPNDPDNSQVSPLVCTPNSSTPFINHQNTYPGFISSANITTIINQDVDTPCLLQVTSYKQSGNDLLFLGDYPLNLSITQGSNLLYTGPLIFSRLSPRREQI